VNAPLKLPESPTPDDAASHDAASSNRASNGHAPETSAKATPTQAEVLPLQRRTRSKARAEYASRRDRARGWMTFGIGIKRWAVLALLGLTLAATGAALAAAYVAIDLSLWVMELLSHSTHLLLDSVLLGFVFLIAGVILVAVGLRGTFKAVERAYAGTGAKRDFLETALRRRKLEHGERVVALGGGTGLSAMLRGIKEYSSNITAVVTMADDGGSSGRLREEGMLPPGDLRNCLAALAETESLMEDLFQHRFSGLGALKGHSLGNLIVAALFEQTGNFESAVQSTARVLAVRGQVLPSTLDNIRLGAHLKSGEEVLGQSAVMECGNIERVFLVPAEPRALPGVITAIRDAEVIIIGPGSLYTSILPNLLVPEIAEAIKASHAPKIYVCNVMTQPGETQEYSAADHVRAIVRHIGPNVVTHVLVNSGRVPDDVLERYHAVGADMVPVNEDELEMLGVRTVKVNFVEITDSQNFKHVVRHNPQKLAQAIFRVVAKL
jgi:uncharacterized cofD-like protein